MANESQLFYDDDTTVSVFTTSGGDTEWRLDGQRHRENDLPAQMYADGTNKWYTHNKLHRDGGRPAIEYPDGGCAWYTNGRLTRGGGLPAVIFGDGKAQWWTDGKYVSDVGPELWSDAPKLPKWVGQSCVISLETIEETSSMCKCDVCNAVCLFGALSEWLVVSKTCPHCRTPWTSTVKYC